MDLSYFHKINNTYLAKSKQEVDLYLLNRHVDNHFADTFDYHIVKKNGKPFELLIIKDSDGNTFKKKIKSKHSSPFNLGDYIEWNNQIWLVTLLDTDDKTYHSGYMFLCTVPLRWQNSEGKIIERYAYSEDFTKYSSGVTGNNTLTVGDNQYGLTLPVDSETKLLYRDMRFPIDFEDSKKPDIYKITNRKVSLNNNEYFGRGGTFIITLSLDTFNANTDKCVDMDNDKKIWICDYKELSSLNPFNKSTNIKAIINGKTNLKTGYARTYTVTFTDEKNDKYVDWNSIDFTWNVNADFYVEQSVNNNQITLSVNDESLIGRSFILQCFMDDIVVGQLEIEIVEGF